MPPLQSEQQQPTAKNGQRQSVWFGNHAVTDDIVLNQRTREGAGPAGGRGIDGAVISLRTHLGYDDRVYQLDDSPVSAREWPDRRGKIRIENNLG